ncbi:hypothetical protein EDD16DRAFT_1740707 [Pisolithus croceorrhizus]|nr:hypothetical protein EDD16DRAFT_1740707 [Pisolithus croceorrhizus]
MYYSEDDLTTKLVVAAIWILDTLHISFVCHVLYYYLIVNYGAPTSLEYIVWFARPSISKLLSTDENLQVIPSVGSGEFFCIGYSSMNISPLSPSTEVVGDRPNREYIYVSAKAPSSDGSVIDTSSPRFGIASAALLLVNNADNFAAYTRFYSSIPAAFAIALAEVLVTVPLCVLLYDGRSWSATPRMKRLMNTLIIYAVNRCLLTLPVIVAEVAVTITGQVAWSMGLNFIIGKLYANSLLASLNSRQHLRSQASSTGPCHCTNVVFFANPRKSSEDIESSNNREKHADGADDYSAAKA